MFRGSGFVLKSTAMVIRGVILGVIEFMVAGLVSGLGYSGGWTGFGSPGNSVVLFFLAVVLAVLVSGCSSLEATLRISRFAGGTVISLEGGMV